MATNYIFQVSSLNGETFSDGSESDMRGMLASLEISPEFNLGPRVATRKDPDVENVRHYYYHNGRITVTTRYNQLTPAQRQGRRSY